MAPVDIQEHRLQRGQGSPSPGCRRLEPAPPRDFEITAAIRRQPEIHRRYSLATSYLDKLSDCHLIFLMKVHPELTGLIFQYALPERWADAAMWTQTREEVVNWQFLMKLVKRRGHGHQEFMELAAIALRIEERDLRTAVQTLDRLMDEQARFDPLRRGAAHLSQVDLWYRKTRKQMIWNQVVKVRELQRAIAAKADLRHYMPAIRPTTFPPTNAISLRAAERSPRVLDQLMSEDCHEALTMLRRLGIFNPVGYTRMGHSYLHHALMNKAFRVARMICSLYTPQDWVSSSIISDITHAIAVMRV
ncbi:hypothetical protein BJX65DRAFT_314782 [Aspergillus insuetus]